MLKTGVIVLTNVKKIKDREADRTRKAMSVAVRVEAYRLMMRGINLLKTGKLGLQPLTKLKGKSGRRRDPLEGLHMGLIYRFDPATISAQVGFLGGTAGTEWQKKIAEKSAPGYTWVYPPRYIERLQKAGIHLRKGVTSASVPARDIVGALLECEGENKIANNIERNFDAKMRGERI